MEGAPEDLRLDALKVDEVPAEVKRIKEILSAAGKHLLETLEDKPDEDWEIAREASDEDVDKRPNLDDRINRLWTLLSQQTPDYCFDVFLMHVLGGEYEKSSFPFCVWRKMRKNPGHDPRVFKEKLERVVTTVLPNYANIPNMKSWCEDAMMKQLYSAFLPRFKEPMRKLLLLGSNAEQDRKHLIEAGIDAARNLGIRVPDVRKEPDFKNSVFYLNDWLSLEEAKIIHETYLPKIKEGMRRAMYDDGFVELGSYKRKKHLVEAAGKTAKALSYALPRYMWCDRYEFKGLRSGIRFIEELFAEYKESASAPPSSMAADS